MIEINHLTKKYAANVAVYDLNLTLEPGHIYGFLGPNGAGKSTTMNIITGYIGATSGEVKINGYDINQDPEKAKACIGYLPEMPPLYGDMRVREYLKFAAGLKNIQKEDQDEAIRQVINKTKLYQVENRLIRNLSKGFRQRVGLAQALLGSPEIIIMDEPTVGLDPKQIIEIRTLIKSLKKDHTVVLSSHIMQEISAVCDHVFIINNGKIVANDSMKALETSMSGAQRVSVKIFGMTADALRLAEVSGAARCRLADSPAMEEEESEEDLLPVTGETEVSETAGGEEEPEETAAESEETVGETEVLEAAGAEEEAEETTEEPDETVGETEVLEAAGGEEEPEETAAEPEETVGETEVLEAAGGEAEPEETAAEPEETVGETEVLEAADEEEEKETAADPAGEAVEAPEEEVPHEVEVLLTADEDADIRENIFRFCIENELTLLEMKTLSRTLEDVYLELTEGRRERVN